MTLFAFLEYIASINIILLRKKEIDLFSKTAYAIKTLAGKYLHVMKTRFGLQVFRVESPELALIWMDCKQADDLLFHVQSHIGEKCEIVQFDLTEKAS
jgi:hypothetical protein